MEGIFLIVYIETNWILCCVLRQDADFGHAQRLLDEAGPQRRLCMPAFCVAESMSAIRSKEDELRAYLDAAQKHRRESARLDIEHAHQYANSLGDLEDRGHTWLNE